MLIIPPAIESERPTKKQIVHEPNARRSETITIGETDEYSDTMSKVRTMITMAIGTLKEVKAQVREKPGARFLIGEILCCLGNAKKAATINLAALNFKEL